MSIRPSHGWSFHEQTAKGSRARGPRRRRAGGAPSPAPADGRAATAAQEDRYDGLALARGCSRHRGHGRRVAPRHDRAARSFRRADHPVRHVGADPVAELADQHAQLGRIEVGARDLGTPRGRAHRRLPSMEASGGLPREPRRCSRSSSRACTSRPLAHVPTASLRSASGRGSRPPRSRSRRSPPC